MIYVFLVDTGTMLTFEMNLALENVSVLKEVVERAVKVPPEKQVLLISGGEALEQDKRLCHYSAGTDTSPIFLFSKATIEGHVPPSPSVDYGADTDLKEQVDGALNMPASYNTVVARAQLAQQIHEHTRDHTLACNKLVHDQHLQQQGWAAVVANLEDIVSAFKSRYETFESAFQDYLKARQYKFTLLENFEDDLKLLARIPVLPQLLGEAQREGEVKEEAERKTKSIENENQQQQQQTTTGTTTTAAVSAITTTTMSMTLLEWISAKDCQHDVEQIAELCHRGLTQINESLVAGVGEEVAGVVKQADNPQMKVIKGLGERLCGLEQLMHDANMIVNEQNNFAQALLQNQQRASKVNDPSIFPDLCTSHRKNLMHMLKNFQRVQDIKRRCIKAKEELSENLHFRLKWIMYIEHKLYELDTRLQMHQENVRRLCGLLQVVEQIHRAPSLYVAAVTEVARRHAFSRHFLAWATQLSEESGDVWRREVETRRQFLQVFSPHFLSSLFPGMEDLPPDFATHPPPPFDTELPKVTEANIEQLRTLLPELSSYLVVEAVEAVPPLLHLPLTTTPSSTTAATTTATTNTVIKQPQQLESPLTTTTTAATTSTSITTTVTTILHSSTAITTTATSPVDVRQEIEVDTEGFERVEKTGLPKDPITTTPMDVPVGVAEGGGEREGDGGRSKSKHRFNDVNDPKHIKLENVTMATTEKSPEFATTEFYIEDPMPAVFPGTPLAAPGEALGTRGGAEVATTNRGRDEELAAALRGGLVEAKGQVAALRSQLLELQAKVEQEGSSYANLVSCLSSRLLPLVLEAEERGRAEVERVRGEERSREEEREREVRERLDLQTHQLLDAQREVEMYQDQLRRHQETLQLTTTEFEEARRQLEEERTEAVKQLSLEHEVEIVALRQRWEQEEATRQDQVAALTQKLIEAEERVRETERMRDVLEESFRSKLEEGIREEKQKIVQILESSFSERERKALCQLRELLTEEHQREVQRILTENADTVTKECNLLRTQLAAEWQLVMERERAQAAEREEVRQREEREAWESEKERELKERERELEVRLNEEREGREEEVRQQVKMELEGLRSRFKMMATASMEKSPSQTSLEKVERGDLMELETHEAILSRMRDEMKREREAVVETEREEWQRKSREEEERRREEERQRQEDMRREERRRIEAEKQIVFNEAIKTVTQDKERVIEDLRLRVQLLTDENEKMRRLSGRMVAAGGGVVAEVAGAEPDPFLLSLSAENEVLKARCETQQKDLARLETEILRAKRLSFTTTAALPEQQQQQQLSVSFTDATSADLAKLQQENQELRDKLTRSATSLVERGKISVVSCQTGEAILLIWDEAHAHYRVLLEGNPHLHFLHTDSYATLGLSKDSPQRLYCPAEVISKEFCQAKKDENRFRVPKGTKFYRVMAKLWEEESISRRMGESTTTTTSIVTTSSGTTMAAPKSPSNTTSTTTTTTIATATAGVKMDLSASQSFPAPE